MHFEALYPAKRSFVPAPSFTSHRQPRLKLVSVYRHTGIIPDCCITWYLVPTAAVPGTGVRVESGWLPLLPACVPWVTGHDKRSPYRIRDIYIYIMRTPGIISMQAVVSRTRYNVVVHMN